jgi:soluble lytic murein transglycosylase-like protein
MSEKIYTEMLDEQYGNLLSKHGSLGLAELILKQIGGSGNSDAALAMLKGLKNSSPILNEKEFLPSQQTAAATTGGVSQWQPFITEASEKFGVDSSLISAVIAQESGGNPSAVSSKGAKGLMQLMDSTAKDMGVTKVFQPRQNILGGTRYLKQLLDKYNGDETQALASYNAGPAAVDKYNGVPPYPETQQYINKVTSLKKQFSPTQLTKEAAHE